MRVNRPAANRALRGDGGASDELGCGAERRKEAAMASDIRRCPTCARHVGWARIVSRWVAWNTWTCPGCGTRLKTKLRRTWWSTVTLLYVLAAAFLPWQWWLVGFVALLAVETWNIEVQRVSGEAAGA